MIQSFQELLYKFSYSQPWGLKGEITTIRTKHINSGWYNNSESGADFQTLLVLVLYREAAQDIYIEGTWTHTKIQI